MGALADLKDTTPEPTHGDGQKLVTWWQDIADDDDRQLFRGWVESGRTLRSIAASLRASGYPIANDTVSAGVRLLKARQWEL